MTLKSLTVVSALALLVMAAACEKSPTRPSVTETKSVAEAAVTDATSVAEKSGVSLTTPTPVSPADGAQMTFASQPARLVVGNGVTTGSTALTYTFEVASDSGFANKVYTKDGVAEGGGGQTSLTIDRLTGARTYFWHARSNSGTTQGLFSTARSFTVGPEVVLGTPVLASPGANATVSGQPSLTVNNVTRTGPAGQIVYRFEVSTSSSFASLAFVQTVNEQSGASTSVTVSATLTDRATYFWRVQASDPSNAVTTAFSGANSFVVQLFSMRDAFIHDNPPDLGFWPETAKITSIVFTPGSFEVDFDRRTGPNRWLDVPFGTGDLQYTLGICLNFGGAWHCSAVVQFWFGRNLGDSAPPTDIALEWFYDARWGALNGHQPVPGEIVGIFVAAGNLRDASYIQATCPRICERSNVALVPWSFGGVTYTFSGDRLQLSSRR